MTDTTEKFEPAPPADRSEHSAECMKEHADHPENCYLGVQECPPRSRCPRCNPRPAPADPWKHCRAVAKKWIGSTAGLMVSDLLDAIAADEAASRDAGKEGT